MNFNSLNQTVASIKKLRKFYHMIRIWDATHKRIIYESENANISGEAPVSITNFSKATLSLREDGNVLEINIPVTIDGHPYCLELIQHSEEDSLQHMQKLLITDPLTNLYNRRYIDDQLPIDLANAFEENYPVSFIYADIDYFKKINDEYGHIAGDCILKETANVFLRLIQKTNGWAARYGGDEFLICLPEMNRKSSVQIAYKIRHAVESKSFYINDHFIKVTCSFGVQTLYNTSSIHTVNQVIGLLDKKLYQAKKKSRNRVVV
ncbi:GGDEF domain-containing protein [Clostridium aminobutyricum]|uniref:GGDEF domain-containing protein n=1 Tax=Clostridium aminobutyricum TaxID=33953 RepID=A0A939IFR0_CLOAM|nr:GGDEF domain-containing protein [Clostridium aminobutyricum]MBN7771745.1 GGDEF domain-containing protein [Clostridium aminobutyricum]